MEIAANKKERQVPIGCVWKGRAEFLLLASLLLTKKSVVICTYVGLEEYFGVSFGTFSGKEKKDLVGTLDFGEKKKTVYLVIL